MDRYLQFFYMTVLAVPCFMLARQFVRSLKSESNPRQRFYLYYGIVWAAAIFVLIVVSKNYIWSEYLG